MAARGVAVVVGGSKGIGRSAALALAAGGRPVVVTYHADPSGAGATVAEITARGGTAAALPLDAGDPAAVQAAFQQAAELGPVSSVVHCPVFPVADGVLAIEPPVWRRSLEVGALSLAWCAQAVAAAMAANGGGSIVAMTSAGSTRVVPRYAAVGVTKAALEALIRYLAVELAPAGIRVNAVAAGPLDTAAFRAIYGTASDRLARLQRATPAPRSLALADVAAAVEFLCSDAAAMITGHILSVDGGLGLL